MLSCPLCFCDSVLPCHIRKIAAIIPHLYRDIQGRGAAALDQIQAKYEDGWASAHGGPGGSPVTCAFDSRIVKVTARTNSEAIFGVEFEAENGKICKIGNNNAGLTANVLQHPGHYLSYISGGNQGCCVNNLRFHWIKGRNEGKIT